MPRLNQERQAQLEPRRIEVAIAEIQKFGYEVTQVDSTQIQFKYKGHTVNYWPYSGWASGGSIQDGRGLKTF